MADASIIRIEVLGSGCAKCKKLYELTQSAAKELGLSTEVVHNTDIQKIIEIGAMSSPVITVNGKIILEGSVPELQMIIELLRKQARAADEVPCCSDKDLCNISRSSAKEKESGGCCCGSC